MTVGHHYIHQKTGGEYVVLCEAEWEKDLTPVIVYQNVKTSRIWVRPKEEFFDGRFIIHHDPNFKSLWQEVKTDHSEVIKHLAD